MTLKKMTLKIVDTQSELFYGSRSTAIIHLLHKGYQIDEEIYQELSQDIKLAKDVLKKMPDNFSPQRKKLVEIIIDKSPSTIVWITEIIKDDPMLQKNIFKFFLVQQKIKTKLKKLEKISCMTPEIWEKLKSGARLHVRYGRIYFDITEASDQEIKITVKQKESPAGNYQNKEKLVEICSEFLVPITEKIPVKITVDPIPYQ